MTDLLVNNVAGLSLVRSVPQRLSAPAQMQDTATPLFAVAEMVASSRPVEVLTSLSQILANAGYRCVIEVVETDGVSYRINRPHPGQEARTWGELTVLLEAQDALVCDGRQVGIAFHGPATTDSDADSRTDSDTGDEDNPVTMPTEWAFTAAMQVTRPVTSSGAELAWVGPGDVQVIRALVDHAVAVITAERLRLEVAEQRRRIANLELALTSNREIGVALGIIMSTRRCSSKDAFAVLRSVSQNSNRKIRDVAAQLAYTGELPTETQARGSAGDTQHSAPL